MSTIGSPTSAILDPLLAETLSMRHAVKKIKRQIRKKLRAHCRPIPSFPHGIQNGRHVNSPIIDPFLCRRSKISSQVWTIVSSGGWYQNSNWSFLFWHILSNWLPARAPHSMVPSGITKAPVTSSKHEVRKGCPQFQNPNQCSVQRRTHPLYILVISKRLYILLILYVGVLSSKQEALLSFAHAKSLRWSYHT